METASRNKLTKVDLAMIKCVCETIESIVACSMGPSADLTLMTSSTGHATVTKDGFIILKSLHIVHPIGKFLLQSLTKVHNYTADGSKIYLLCISEALRVITRIPVFSSSMHSNVKQSSQIRLSRAFGNILKEVVPQFVRSILCQACTIIPATDSEHICLMATNVASTLLTSHSSVRQHQYHCPVFLSVINNILAEENFLQLLDHFISNFDLLHIKVPNLTVEESRLIAPYVIQRNFSCFSGFSDQMPVRLILCQCNIDKSDAGKPSEILRLRTPDDVGKIMQHRNKCVELFLKQCYSCGICLILSTEAIPEFVNANLQKYGISAIGNILQEDMEFLQFILSKTAIFDTNDEISSINVAEAKSCAPIIIGGHDYVHLDVTGYTDKVKHQILLSDLTENLCKQMARKLYKTLKAIQVCFDNSFILSSVGVDRSCFGLGLCTSGSVSLKEATIIETEGTGRNRFSFVARQKTTSLDEHISLYSNRINLLNDHLGQKIHEESLDHNAMYIIQAGGVFEFLASDFFLKTSKTAKNSDTITACQILSKSVLAVPRALHKNASRHHSRSNRYIETENQIMQEMKKGRLLGINKNGDACSMSSEKAFEPVATKVAILCAIIQNLEQLLRFEAIIDVGQ